MVTSKHSLWINEIQQATLHNKELAADLCANILTEAQRIEWLASIDGWTQRLGDATTRILEN